MKKLIAVLLMAASMGASADQSEDIESFVKFNYGDYIVGHATYFPSGTLAVSISSNSGHNKICMAEKTGYVYCIDMEDFMYMTK